MATRTGSIFIGGFEKGLDVDDRLTVAQRQIARALVRKFWHEMYETLVFSG